MKDKEKQIQEIAQIICGRCEDGICIIDNTSCDSSCYWARKAEAIYNVGYRKYPEDSVVLSKEEYKRITKELVTEQRATEIAKEYFEKIRKEMTEKIFKMLISKLDSNQFLSGKRIIMEVDVENLAKQFDVEIEG